MELFCLGMFFFGSFLPGTQWAYWIWLQAFSNSGDVSAIISLTAVSLWLSSLPSKTSNILMLFIFSSFYSSLVCHFFTLSPSNKFFILPSFLVLSLLLVLFLSSTLISSCVLLGVHSIVYVNALNVLDIYSLKSLLERLCNWLLLIGSSGLSSLFIRPGVVLHCFPILTVAVLNT